MQPPQQQSELEESNQQQQREPLGEETNQQKQGEPLGEVTNQQKQGEPLGEETNQQQQTQQDPVDKSISNSKEIVNYDISEGGNQLKLSLIIILFSILLWNSINILKDN